MSARSASDWVVVKFGGTSVSSLLNWRNIALIVKRRVAAGHRVLVVHSAVTRITDMLEKLLVAAEAGKPDEALKAIEDRHRLLLTELGLEVSRQLQGYFDELRQVANGIALVRELSDRTRARVMANGELMATEIGSRFLKQQGVDVTWMDARDMLSAEDRGASAKASVLSATCPFAPMSRREKTRGRHAGGDHPGLHRPCRGRRHGNPGPRRLGYFRRLLRRPSAGAPRRDLDRCARHVQRQSAPRARRPPAGAARLRGSAGNRHHRRQGAAPALHPPLPRGARAAVDPRHRSARKPPARSSTIAAPPSPASRRSVRAAASCWCRWRPSACGNRSASSPTCSSASRSAACRST